MHKSIVILLVIIVFLATFAHALERLSLEGCIEIAIINNPGIIAASHKVNEYSQKISQAFGAKLPSITIDGGLRRTYQEPQTSTLVIGGITQNIAFGPDSAGDTLNYSVNLTQPIYTFGKIESAYDIAVRNYEMILEDFRAAEQDVVFNVKSAYLSVLRAKDMVDLSQESLNMASEHLKQIEEMLSVGLATKNDMLRTKVQVSSSSYTLIQAINGLELAKAGLNVALGRGVDEDYVLDAVNISFDPITESYKDIIARAYKARPDWRRAEISKNIAELSKKAAQSDIWPAFSFMGSYGRTNTTYASYNSNTSNWSLAAAGSWKIFDGMANLAKVNEAEAAKAGINANINMLKNYIGMDVKGAYLDFGTKIKLIETAVAGVESAKENLRVAELRYKSGVGTNIEALDAQTALTKAETDYTQAKYDLELARAKRDKAEGKDYFQKLVGTIKYIELEGGFIGFISANGEHFTPIGEKVAAIAKEIGTGERSAILYGYPKKGVMTISMWGTPFYVVKYAWK
ncbi:MAG: TolC family protein [bacterium]